jgi:hypothetical protein
MNRVISNGDVFDIGQTINGVSTFLFLNDNFYYFTFRHSAEYEYDQNEMITILERNFGEWDITAVGLNEVRLPNGQWGTDLTTDLNNCWVFFCVLQVKKD